MTTINVRVFDPEHKNGKRIDVDKDQGIGVFADDFAEGRKIDLSCHYTLRRRGSDDDLSQMHSFSSAGIEDGTDLEIVQGSLPWRTEATGTAVAEPKPSKKKTTARKKTTVRKKTTARRGTGKRHKQPRAARARKTDDLAETREAVTQAALEAVSQLAKVAWDQVDAMLEHLEKIHAELGEAIEKVKASKPAAVVARRGGRRAA